MTTPAYLVPCLVLLLAACPTDKGATDGQSTADTTASAATDPSTSTTSNNTAVTDSSATQDTGDCAPIQCDECGAGCTAQMVCIGSQASCECDCEENTGGGSVAESTSVQDTGTGTSDATGTTGSGTTGAPAIVCGGDMPFFPEFDRSCAEPADCALGFHQLDCCGSLAALGISAEAAKLFAEAEAECMLQYPQCDCATKPTVADDGNSSPDNDAIQVSCVDGQCRSFVP